MSASVISNSPAPITRPVEKFGAFDLVTGDPVWVDERTYDEQRYGRDEAATAALLAAEAAAAKLA
jgi:hypothetical protein